MPLMQVIHVENAAFAAPFVATAKGNNAKTVIKEINASKLATAELLDDEESILIYFGGTDAVLLVGQVAVFEQGTVSVFDNADFEEQYITESEVDNNYATKDDVKELQKTITNLEASIGLNNAAAGATETAKAKAKTTAKPEETPEPTPEPETTTDPEADAGGAE